MTVVTIPDAQAVVTKCLNDSPDVQALDARAATKLPSEQSKQVKPVVKVTQLDATESSFGVEHLVNFYYQFDCYAGGGDANSPVQASKLSRTVRAVLKSLQGTVQSGVTITDVAFTGHASIPDEAFTPWRERFVLDAEIRCHG
jgi:hypothetical protein